MGGFEKKSVREQVAEALLQRIMEGEWQGNLPSERWLSQQMGVSRDQVHAAILLLRQQGIVDLEGKRNKIIARGQQLQRHGRVVVLTPYWLAGASRGLMHCVDKLKSNLVRQGVEVDVEASVSLLKKQADKSLQRLVEMYGKQAVWVLHRASPNVQRWFSERQLTTLILGTAAEGVESASIDCDHQAAAHHAVGVMSRAGHSLGNVLMLRPANDLEGVARMEQGFCQALQQNGLQACVVSYREEGEALAQRLSQLFGAVRQIEGVVLTSYKAAVFTSGWLAAEKGLVCGRDLSLLSLSDGEALELLYPSVAYYLMEGDGFTAKLVRMIRGLLAHPRSAQVGQSLVMPHYTAGGSICCC